MKRIYFAIASLALLFTGCQKDDETFRTPEEVSSFNQITVIPDGLADTRAHINDAKQVVWEQGDSIGVYSDTDGVVPFVYTSGNTFTATKSVKGTQFYAFYPYSNYPFSNEPVTVDSSNNLHTFIPGSDAVYYYTRTTSTLIAKRTNMPMVGKSTTNEFTFKQTMGMLHFTVKDIAVLNDVQVRGNENELLSGSAAINMSADSPALTLDSATKSVWGNTVARSSFNNKVLAAGEVVDVYIPVPVGTYAKGFTIEINGTDADNEQIMIKKRTDKSLTVERAAMNSYTELDLYGELEAELAKEKAALMAIYTALDGDNWDHYAKRNWNSDKPLYTWWGVGTDNNGHVTSLNFYSWYNMKGDIPAAIGDLLFLDRLYINGEKITSIPKEIGKLDRLWSLEIRGTGISELPDEIGDMRYLSSLYLSNNKNLKSLPKGIGRCINLSYLSLYENAIETLPAEIANASNLRNVTLENNKFTKFPDALANSKSITSLYIWEPEMAGEIPATISNMTALNNLSVHNTQLSGQLPASLGSLPNLQTISLWGNQFEGNIPEAWGNAQNLNYLDVEGNKLSGEVSASILNSKMWANVSSVYLNPQQNDVILTFEGGEVPITGLALDKSSIVVYGRESASVKIGVITTPAVTTDKNLNWDIDNNVGYIDNGIFSGGNLGKGKVTVSKGELSASCDVEVRGIEPENRNVILLVGNTETVKTTKFGDDVAVERWESANEKVATVDANGKITAVGGGSTYVYMYYTTPVSTLLNIIYVNVATTNAELESFTKEAEEGNWDK